MALNLEEKKAVVAEVSSVAADALSAVGAEYNGLTAEQMGELRAKAREQNVYLRVVKNTLARRAVQGTDFECITDGLVGPMLLAFSVDDPGSAGRVIRDFAKEYDALVPKMVAIGGQMLPASELKKLADLPTYDQAIAMLMGVMKAPIEKMVRTIAEPTAKLARTVSAVKDQKQAA